MKIAIAHAPLGDPWVSFRPTGYPSSIRAQIRYLMATEENLGFEHNIITLNRTVLDMVTSSEAKVPGPLFYENVFVWRDDELVPLLGLFDSAWLSHFSLGDLLDRNELDPTVKTP